MNKFQRKRTKAGKYPCKKHIQIWNLNETFAQYLLGALKQYKAYRQSENKYIAEAIQLDEMILAFNEILLDNMHAPSKMKEAEFERLHPDYLEYTFIKRPDGSFLMEYKHKDLIEQINNEITCCDMDKAYYERIHQGLEFYVQALYENLAHKKLNIESDFSATIYMNAPHRTITKLN